MDILKQVHKYSLSVVAVHKIGEVFILFTHDGIYLWGNDKEIQKFQKRQKVK